MSAIKFMRNATQVKVILDQMLAAHAHLLHERFRGAEIGKVRAAEDRFNVTLDWAIEKLGEVE